jgi:hypothetical protein
MDEEPARVRRSRVSISVVVIRLIHCEVIARLIRAGPLFPQLHEDVIEECRGAEAEKVRVHPLAAEGFIEEDEIGQSSLALEMPPAGFMPIFLPVT